MVGRHYGPVGPNGLRGRAKECALLEDVVSAIRRGESRSLVLRGEAGIGKTALLDHLIASAPELSVVRAAGVESEMELVYASVHQLCGPLLDRLERLPVPQRQALEVVFGLSAGGSRTDFLSGWRCWASSRKRLSSVRCSVSSTTRSGSIRPRRRRSGS